MVILIFATDGGDSKPRLKRTTGTGMTQRGVVEYDWAEPDDAGAQVRAAIAAFERTNFSRTSSQLAQLAKSILEASGLPSDPEGAYLVRPEGTCALVTEEMDLGPELDNTRLTLEVAAVHCVGVPANSPEGYAARLVMMLRKARHEPAAGHLDEAMAWAFVAGELVNEAGMKDVF